MTIQTLHEAKVFGPYEIQDELDKATAIIRPWLADVSSDVVVGEVQIKGDGVVRMLLWRSAKHLERWRAYPCPIGPDSSCSALTMRVTKFRQHPTKPGKVQIGWDFVELENFDQ